jgi:hypothetical protein
MEFGLYFHLFVALLAFGVNLTVAIRNYEYPARFWACFFFAAFSATYAVGITLHLVREVVFH